MKKIFVLLMMALATGNLLAKSNFVQVKDGHFVRDGRPYYYVGTNFWYGAILGSEGQGGNRERLCQELDKMKEMGIDNLRILVGSDGKRGVKTKVEPTLQEAPGVYNDTILAGLDYLLALQAKGIPVIWRPLHEARGNYGKWGNPVTMERKVYDDLANGALQDYWDTNLDNRERNAYKRIVTGAVRGVDMVASLDEWDGKTIGVAGSSLGGFLSLAVAALDKRVTFLGVIHDAMCDYEAEIHGVAGGWPHYFYKGAGRVGQAQKEVKLTEVEKARLAGARYYDGVNFARRITVPGWYSFGYNDEVVPPTSAYGLYNTIAAPKTLSIYQMTGHYWYQEQYDEWQNFLTRQLLGK